MSYQYVTFDGVSLPLFDHSQEHAPMQAEPTLVDSIGGAYDWVGTARRKGRKQIISLTGVYFGETTFLVDELGNFIVDDLAAFLIAGDSYQMAQAQVVALLEKKGVRGQLWRKRLDDSVLEWKTARVLSISWPRVWEDHAIKAELTCEFETAMEFWHASTQTATSVNAVAGVPIALNVDNTGQVVDDATITVTRTSGTITAFTLTGGGVSLSWTGSLGASEVLTIDCGAQTVRENTTDSYSGFSLSGSHSAAGWLPLASGANPFVVTVTGGNATVAINHYAQFS
jgi:hypothetical protein